MLRAPYFLLCDESQNCGVHSSPALCALVCTAFLCCGNHKLLVCTALARMLSGGCISVHSVLCQHQFCLCHKVLMCTALACMLSWSCISVHSVLGQHQVWPCHEVLVCTAVAGLVDSSSTDCLHSTHEPQEGEPFGVVLMNSESFRVLRSCFEFRRIVNASRIPPRPPAGP